MIQRESIITERSIIIWESILTRKIQRESIIRGRSIII